MSESIANCKSSGLNPISLAICPCAMFLKLLWFTEPPSAFLRRCLSITFKTLGSYTVYSNWPPTCLISEPVASLRAALIPYFENNSSASLFDSLSNCLQNLGLSKSIFEGSIFSPTTNLLILSWIPGFWSKRF